MESISGTFLADIYKSYPKLLNSHLVTSYNYLPRKQFELSRNKKFLKPSKSSNDQIYIGEVDSSNKKSGFGLLFMGTESIYEGQFDDDKAKGEGRLFKPWLVYEGLFDDLSLSKGKIFNIKDSSAYEGDIKNFKAHGRGKLVCKNQFVYIGNFKDGLKDGTGEMTWENKDRYLGEFSKDKQHGTGRFSSADGTTYEGEWALGKMHGKGVLAVPNNYSYNGMFVSGLKQGHGKCKWNDGKVFEGFWMKGKYDGFGKETSPNGEVLEGIWRNGVFKLMQNEEKVKEPDRSQRRIMLTEESSKSDVFAKSVKLALDDEKFLKELNKQDFSASKNSSKMINPLLMKIDSNSHSKKEVSVNQGGSANQEVSVNEEVSGIKDLQEEESSDPDSVENEMGLAIKDFVLSKSSQNENSYVSRNLEEIDKEFDDLSVSIKNKNKNEKDFDDHSIQKRQEKESKDISISIKEKRQKDEESGHVSVSSEKSSHFFDSSKESRAFESPLKKKVTIQGPVPPNIRIEKLLIDKPQVVPLMEIRAKVRNDPLFQISYQKFKNLSVFQYDQQDTHGVSMVEDWLGLDKEKAFKGFVDENLVPNGNGVLLQRGRIYQGGFVNGKRHGLGRLITPLGRIYEGYWFKGRKQGFGVLTTENETYCGDWLKGLYHGLGVLENSQGCYDGQFIFGICEGNGILHFTDGRSFEGQFKNGVPHGFGNLKFGTEISYEEWKEGAKKTLEVATTKRVTPLVPVLKSETFSNPPDLSPSNSDSEVDIPHEID